MGYSPKNMKRLEVEKAMEAIKRKLAMIHEHERAIQVLKAEIARLRKKTDGAGGNNDLLIQRRHYCRR